ncbi:hypothetical protein [Nocardioides sp.]|uniref:hypothetical protein n=1 Tax=Nocardioides sp. TaxID=35761 RepID=UPI00273563C4|nr:hypothetical protein [Nocardioides sp.]MDP3894477.1 hypothetical protein [Nocardioides sp.]
MNDDKLLNEIRALQPEPTTNWAMTPEGQGVMARAIAMGEASEQAAEKPAVRRARRVVIAGVGAGALLVSGVAAATLALRDADSPTQAGCYETFSAQADTTEASAALVEKIGPVKACAQTLVELGKPVDVSNMVSCVNPDGGRGVFPAPKGLDAASACAEIGWAVDAG